MDIRFTNRRAGFDRGELEKLLACLKHRRHSSNTITDILACLKHWRHSSNTITDIMEVEIRCELAKRDVAEGRWE